MTQVMARRGFGAAAYPILVALLATLTSGCEPAALTVPRPPTVGGPLAAIDGAVVSSLPFTGIAINDAGQVAGTTDYTRALLYTPGHGTVDLGTLGGASSVALAINELGQVVGWSNVASGARHAFLWTPGVGMVDLGTLGGALSSTARGINDQGQVVGESTFPRVDAREPQTHAFLWTAAGGMQDLGALPGVTSSAAYDINNLGHVVGRSFSADPPIFPPTDPEFRSRAFLWTPNQGMQELASLSSGYSVAYAINDAGLVVGKSWLSTFSSPPYGQQLRAVVWAPGQAPRDLGGLWGGPYNSVAYGVNEAGQVVGESDLGIAYREGFPMQGFLWTAADGLEALSPTTGLTTARDINNHQQVVGDGRIATLQLAPGNNLPTAFTGGPYAGTEGTPVELDLSRRDNDDVGFTYRVSFGDGSPDWFDITLPPSRLNHIYGDNGTYTLSLTVRDPKGASDTRTTTVSIANAVPVIVDGSLTAPAAPIPLMNGVANAPISFQFRDLGGQHDMYSAEIACGNGVTLTSTNIPVFDTYTGSTYIGGTGTVTGVCSYTSPGVYTVRATVVDDDQGTSAPAFYRYVVVYDPEGGTTGGSGFFEVSTQGKGKTHFTFDAAFPRGATVPNGSATVRIAGGPTFTSTVIEMLVVSGNRAQFWGTGTMNGATVRFRITAVDGKRDGRNAADAIRIEIWSTTGSAVLYDTQPGAQQDAGVTTVIDGGTVRVRSG